MNLIDTLVESFNNAMGSLVESIPTLIGAVIILLVGVIVGRAVGRLVTSLLVRVNADRWFTKYAGSVYGETTGAMAPTRLLGLLAQWLIYIVFFIAAANFLNWAQVSSLRNDFIAWLPNLVAAIVIVVAAPVIGQFLRTMVTTSSQGLGAGNAALLGRLVQVGVVLFGVMAALTQVGIATDLITTLFQGFVAAMAIAFGLAFGLGGRDVAAEVSRAAWGATRTVTASSAAAAAAAEAESHPSAGGDAQAG
jgi:hypothetical protein